jgi:hypothetical protein
MPEARTPRPDDRPPAGLWAGLLIVSVVIAVHLFFALVIGLGREEPALADPGATVPSATCVAEADVDPPVTGPATPCAAAEEGRGPEPASPTDTPEPAVGGRGSY